MSSFAREMDAPPPKKLLDVAPGTTEQVRIPIALRASGDPLQLTIHVARGTQPGPVVGLVATVSGDAAWGARVIMESLAQLDLENMSGSIVALPVANPIAFESFTRTTGQGMNTDFNSLGKTFPGDRDGWLTQRMSAIITEYFLDNVDVVVSYASGTDISIHYTLINGETSEAEVKSRDLSRLLGTELVFIYPKSPHPNGLTELAKSQGKPAVVVEMGGTGELPANYLETCTSATGNLLKGLGMVSGEPILPARQLIMRPPRMLPRIGHGGLFEPTAGVETLGAVVDGGTPLGRVISPHTFEELQSFTAPYRRSAMLCLRTRFSRVNPGDYAYIIADGDTDEYWERPENWKVRL